jgi:hypothetical protein
VLRILSPTQARYTLTRSKSNAASLVPPFKIPLSWEAQLLIHNQRDHATNNLRKSHGLIPETEILKIVKSANIYLLFFPSSI